MDAEKFKITPQDMEGKGVSAQSNPMELPEAEAKAVFDQLMKEVMVPRFNVLLEALKPIDLTPDLEKPVSSAVQAALDLKVDKERKTGSETEYKVLSDNNYSDQEAIKVSSAARDRHTHENKTVLDGITSQDVLDWRGGNVLTKDNEAPYEPVGQYHPATKDYVDKNYSGTEKEKVAEVYDKRHTHENKATLDEITVQDLVDWRGGNVLTKSNTVQYIPTAPYHPATMKYVDDKVVQMGSADMQKSVYDIQNKATDIFAYTDNLCSDVLNRVNSVIANFTLKSFDIYNLFSFDGCTMSERNVDGNYVNTLKYISSDKKVAEMVEEKVGEDYVTTLSIFGEDGLSIERKIKKIEKKVAEGYDTIMEEIL